MPTSININNGVVLDPFAIHLTGLMRKHRGIKTSLKTSALFDPLHGEVKFKQAFVNACHFAEQMTVVGPIAQLTWDRGRTDPITQALHWKADPNNGANEHLLNHIRQFMNKAKWENVKSERWQDSDNFFLHMLPDMSLARNMPESDERYKGRYDEYHDNLFLQLFRNPDDAGAFVRDEVKTKFEGSGDYAGISQGAPTLGLMAVIFTFKKPERDSRWAEELTNLAVFPPMVFLLPCMLPAGAELMRTGSYLADRAVQTPTISTYRISLGHGGNILPYAQPYFLSSVDPRGKAPDTLRSLSDVFKALWSQATQYSAWNMSFNVDLHAEPRKRISGVPWDIMGQLCLDPMGAGRRIRGHNRFMGNYALEGVNFLYETDLNLNKAVDGAERNLVGWQTHGSIVKNAFQRQLRTSTLSTIAKPKESIFVTPSFLSEDTTKRMIPLALAMARFMYTGHGLETFLDGNVLGNVTPDTIRCDPREKQSKSFVDQIIENSDYLDEDTKNVGAIPVHRVPAELVFDPDGDPTVFGLRNDISSRRNMAEEGELTDEHIDNIKKGTEILGNFPLLDALCSSSTRELTEVFKEVKQKSFKEGTKAKELLDESLAIDIFTDVDSMV